MADKIDQITLPNSSGTAVSYDIDLPPDATPSIASLTVSGNTSIGGTLTLTKTQDLAGTANNSPALIIGGAATAAHIEIDPNEIHAKADGTTVAPLYLNNEGGVVYTNGSAVINESYLGFTASGKNYPVAKSDGGKLYVNVPWTDNNTTYSAPALWNSGSTTWTAGNNVTCSGNGEWSFDCTADSASDTTHMWHVWSSLNSKTILACYPGNNHVEIPNGYLNVGSTVYATDLSLTKNGITTTLGSQNSGWFHISSGAPVYFGESIAVNGNIELYNHATMQYNSTEDCIEFVFA